MFPLKTESLDHLAKLYVEDRNAALEVFNQLFEHSKLVQNISEEEGLSLLKSLSSLCKIWRNDVDKRFNFLDFIDLVCHNSITTVVVDDKATNQRNLAHLAAREGSLELLTFLLCEDQDQRRQGTHSQVLFDEPTNKLLVNDSIKAVMTEQSLLDNATNEDWIMDRHKMLDRSALIAVNTIALGGWSALMLAAQNGHTETCVALLGSDKYTAVNNVSNNGWSALMLAAQNGNTRTCVSLLGSDTYTAVNNVSKDGWTALMIAAQNGHSETCVALLRSDKYTALNNISKDGWSALMIAARYGHPSTCVALLGNDKYTALNNVDKYGTSALMLAAHNGHTETCVALLGNDKYTALNNVDENGWSALMLAAQNGHSETCVALLGSDKYTALNNVSKNGWSALMIAAQNGHTATCVALLGSDKYTVLSDINKDGWSALMLAAQNGHTTLFVALLGSDRFTRVNNVDRSGYPAWCVAALRGEIRVVEAALRSFRCVSSGNYVRRETNSGNPIVDCLFSHDGNVDFSKWLLQSYLVEVIHSSFKASLLSPRKFIDSYLSEIGIPSNMFEQWMKVFKTLRDCTTSHISAPTMHVHVVGPANSGKSVAVKWLKKVLESDGVSINMIDRVTEAPIQISVDNGRTRGIETHSVWGRTLTGDMIHFLIHDYGGQEEFLLQHPDSLTISNSIYLLVMPIYEVTCDHRGRIKDDSEIEREYIDWLKLIHSMVRKQIPLHALVEGEDNQHVADSYATPGIPLISVLNKFSKIHKVRVSDSKVANVSKLLQSSLQRVFSTAVATTSNNFSSYDFVVPKMQPILLNATTKHGVDRIKPLLMELVTSILQLTSVAEVVGEADNISNKMISSRSAVVEFVSNKLAVASSDLTKLPWLCNKDQWMLWLKTELSAYGPVVEVINSLTEQFKDILLDALAHHCNDALVASNIIAILDQELNCCSVITNPSMLTSAIMGDIFYWFHKQSNSHQQSMKLCLECKNSTFQAIHRRYDSRKLSDKDIDSIFAEVNSWYKQRKLKDITAYDLLAPFGGATKFPIIDLLVRMKLCLPIRHDNDCQLLSWLIGLEPFKPKELSLTPKLTNIDWTYWICRTFTLPDAKSIFFPGYFLRLFTFICTSNHSNKCDIWADAMNCVWFEYDSCLPMSERAILIESTDDALDGSGFTVTLIYKARSEASIDDCAKLAFQQMNNIRAFIHRHMWGLQLIESCVTVDDRLLFTQTHKPLRDVENSLFNIDWKKDASLYYGLLRNAYGIWELRPDVNSWTISFDITDYKLATEKIDSDVYAMAAMMQQPLDAINLLHGMAKDDDKSRQTLVNVLRAYYMNLYMKPNPVHTQSSSLPIHERCQYAGLSLKQFNDFMTNELERVTCAIEIELPISDETTFEIHQESVNCCEDDGLILGSSKDNNPLLVLMAKQLINSNRKYFREKEYLARMHKCLNENHVLDSPLFIAIEKIKYTVRGTKFGDALMTIAQTDYWKSIGGSIYIVKYLCQVCKQPPKGFKGHKIFKIYPWAIDTLRALTFSLKILEFALRVGGIPNGIGEIGTAASQIFGVDSANQIAQTVQQSVKAFDKFFDENGVSADKVQEWKDKLSKKCDEWSESAMQYQHKYTDREEVSFEDIQESEFVVDIPYVQAINNLFSMFKSEECGLVKITRPNLDVAWVCGEKSCQSCFLKTGYVALRYTVKDINDEQTRNGSKTA